MTKINTKNPSIKPNKTKSIDNILFTNDSSEIISKSFLHRNQIIQDNINEQKLLQKQKLNIFQ